MTVRYVQFRRACIQLWLNGDTTFVTMQFKYSEWVTHASCFNILLKISMICLRMMHESHHVCQKVAAHVRPLICRAALQRFLAGCSIYICVSLPWQSRKMSFKLKCGRRFYLDAIYMLVNHHGKYAAFLVCG